MNRQLAKTIVESFRDNDPNIKSFRYFNEWDWRSVKHWLDSHGLTIYFFYRLRDLPIESRIPPGFFATLEQNARDHRLQAEEQFAEFSSIVKVFKENSIPFAVQKGFSLVPDYSPAFGLRLQMDLDFLVAQGKWCLCERLLVQRGYVLQHRAQDSYQHEWKFRKGEKGLPHVRNLYKPKGEFTVELHFPGPNAGGCDFDNVIVHSLEGIEFPVLPKAEVFSGLCRHIFRHVRAEVTRVSWLLEFRRFVLTNKETRLFWTDIRGRCSADRDLAIAIGAVTLLAVELFGNFAPQELTSLTEEVLSDSLRASILRYSWDIALAEFPGTKLYLLIEGELTTDRNIWRSQLRRALLPFHPPPKVTQPGSTNLERSRHLSGQLRHLFIRTRFHIREGFRVSFELTRQALIERRGPAK
jgi:hypothetical protein